MTQLYLSSTLYFSILCWTFKSHFANIILRLKYKYWNAVFSHCIHYFAEHRDKFGDVFTLQLNNPIVFLNSAEAVHEAFVKKADSFSNRPMELSSPAKQLGIHGREWLRNSVFTFMLTRLIAFRIISINSVVWIVLLTQNPSFPTFCYRMKILEKNRFKANTVLWFRNNYLIIIF